MSSINLVQAKPFTLLEPIGTSETEISVKNFVDIYGEQVVMSGTVQYATLEPTSLDNQEIISFTDIVIISDTISKLTGVTRGLDAQPDPVTGLYSSSPTQAKSHAGGALCILSDNPQVWDKKTSKDEDETVTGNWTFTEPVTIPTPVAGTDAVTKDYADGLTYAGAPDASTTVKGVTRLTTSPNVTLGTCTITIATPGVITLASHGLTLNDSVEFTTTGTLPTGIVASTKYFVLSSGLTTNEFQISATLGGTAINTSVGQSGTHTLIRTTPRAVSETDTRLPSQAENDAMAGNSGSPSGSNRFLTENYIPSIRSDVIGQFGAGSDVACNFDGTNTFSFASKVGSVYTLTRDVDATTIVVAVGVTINTANYIFNANTSITNNGTIQNNGNAGSVGGLGGTSAAAGGDGGTATAAGTLGANIAGSIGGTGGVDAGVGVAGTNGTNQTSVGSNGVAGGASGTSSGTQGAASTGGTNTSETITVDLGAPITPSTLTSGSVTTVKRINRISPKTSTNGYSLSTSSGSGGGAGGPSKGGGGGGAGATGGALVISAPIITNSATGIIKSAGGNGGNGGDGVAANGGSGRLSGAGGGGGGGGNGGTIVLIYKTLTNSGSITAPGGTGGTGGQPGPNTAGYGVGTAGSNGTNGASGKIYSAAITG